MMKQEFEVLAGMVVTAAEYAAIEQEYNDAPADEYKDKFVKRWLSEGGRARLDGQRMKRIAELERALMDEVKQSALARDAFDKVVKREADLKEALAIANAELAHNAIEAAEKMASMQAALDEEQKKLAMIKWALGI